MTEFDMPPDGTRCVVRLTEKAPMSASSTMPNPLDAAGCCVTSRPLSRGGAAR